MFMDGCKKSIENVGPNKWCTEKLVWALQRQRSAIVALRYS